MKINRIYLSLVLLGIMLGASACIGRKAAPTATPALPEPAAAPAPTSAPEFPATVEDSLFAALAFYRQQGYEAFKPVWLTDEFSARSPYADFLGTTINETPTSPAALMGWEILGIEQDDPAANPPGTMRLLVKTTYQGGGLVCRWLKFLPPEVTGNHWRISDNQNLPCDGQASIPAEGQTNQIQPEAPAPSTPEPTATGGPLFWYPCPSLPASALQIGSKAYVNPDPPLALNVHNVASTSLESVMGTINPGDVITISYGPACAESRVWWGVNMKVELTPGSGSYEEYDGWVSEMESHSYYNLLPCPATGACGGGFTPQRTKFVPPEDLTARAK